MDFRGQSEAGGSGGGGEGARSALPLLNFGMGASGLMGSSELMGSMGGGSSGDASLSMMVGHAAFQPHAASNMPSLDSQQQQQQQQYQQQDQYLQQQQSGAAFSSMQLSPASIATLLGNTTPSMAGLLGGRGSTPLGVAPGKLEGGAPVQERQNGDSLSLVSNNAARNPASMASPGVTPVGGAPGQAGEPAGGDAAASKGDNGAGGSAGGMPRSEGSDDADQGGGSGRDEHEQGGDDGGDGAGMDGASRPVGMRSGGRVGSSRYESQKRRDWNTFGQYLKNHRPPVAMSRCSPQHVVEFLRYLDQFGKTKVHADACQFYGLSGPHPCACPMKQAWGSLDSLIGRLRAAYEENGGKPENNPFAARIVRVYLRDTREQQGKARGMSYEKKKRKRQGAQPQAPPPSQPQAGLGGAEGRARGGEGGSSSKDHVGTFSPPAVESGARHAHNDAASAGRGGGGGGGMGMGAGSLQEQRGLGHLLGPGGGALMPMGGGQGGLQPPRQQSPLLSLPLHGQQQQQLQQQPRMGETQQGQSMGGGQQGQQGQGLLEQFNATLRNQLALQNALQGQGGGGSGGGGGGGGLGEMSGSSLLELVQLVGGAQQQAQMQPPMGFQRQQQQPPPLLQQHQQQPHLQQQQQQQQQGGGLSAVLSRLLMGQGAGGQGATELLGQVAGLQSLPPEANLLGQLLLSQALGGGGAGGGGAGGMQNMKPLGGGGMGGGGMGGMSNSGGGGMGMSNGSGGRGGGSGGTG